MSKTQMQMPKYKCHKEVWALKIKNIVKTPNCSLDLFFDDDEFLPDRISIEDSLHSRIKFTDEDFGYLVCYEGEYRSWSPSKAFEEGYTLIE